MEENPPETARLAVWVAAGELLRAIRLKRGYSRQQLAARAGVSVELLAAYESGRERFPGIEAWWRLATALGVGLLTLLKQAELQAGATDEGGELVAFVDRLVGESIVTSDE